MVEVLDHYHGPCSRKLWLLAFAESANDGTRAGWSPRWKLAHRADVSASRASHIAAELAAEGVVKRDGGGYRGAPVRYVLAPLADWVRPDSNLSGAGKGACGSNLTGAGKGASGAGKGASGGRKGASGGRKGAPRQQPIPHIPQDPSSLRAERDPRTLLAGLGATEREIEVIIDGIKNDPRVRHPAAYLRGAIERGDGPGLIADARRGLAAEWRDGEASPARPEWCGNCDERTRLIEQPDGTTARRCPDCHPLGGAP